MRIKVFILIAGVSIFMLSCGSHGGSNEQVSGNTIVQKDDGTVSLKLDKAVCYNDATDPANNTADWNVVFSKPGRFKVWISSATRDTVSLDYINSVRVNILDDHLEVTPVVDKVVHNASDVPSSYFRADSYVGSFYVPEPGEYNIQVISEKIVAGNYKAASHSRFDDTMFLSVNLTPAIR
jgi:hypothetical protein